MDRLGSELYVSQSPCVGEQSILSHTEKQQDGVGRFVVWMWVDF